MMSSTHGDRDDDEMKVDPTRAAALVSQLQGVSERIAAATSKKNVSA